jgi:signal transduction histidine kinase
MRRTGLGQDMTSGLRDWWEGLSLATRFAWASGVVLVAATVAIGSFVVSRIEDSVVRNSANATAIYMESFLSPISQQLATGELLSPGASRAMEEIFTNTALGDRVVSFKIWSREGRVIEASNPDIEGQQFEITEELQRALDGTVVATMSGFGDAEDTVEAAMGLSLVEIYSPIHAAWSGEIVAVAEFYEVNPALQRDLAEARRAAWATVTGIVLALGSVLYVIVLGGSRTIEAQRAALDARLADLADLSARNTELRLRVQGAAARAAEQTDRSMRRIGADLHDGPAQHLAYAALRLDNLRDKLGDPERAEAELETVRGAVAGAMAEVRALSRGLSLPEIAGLSAARIVRLAVEAHEARTGHAVEVDELGEAEPVLSMAERICVFRFVQEGLNNASRHADGAGMAVTLETGRAQVRLVVGDRGPGPGDRVGLGLAGLRDRVESLGGSFALRLRDGGGTEIAMTIEPGATEQGVHG